MSRVILYSMNMDIHGWGRDKKVSVTTSAPNTIHECSASVLDKSSLIARGLGRSYGDSSLAPRILDSRSLDHFIAFDETTGQLTCEAGVSLDEILKLAVPRGWFLPVTPGTKFVTVGGAIAGDVHGKNHLHVGSFCEHVVDLEILIGSGEVVLASRNENSDLFHATCGGLGLTGVIISATITLIRIQSSQIRVSTSTTQSLDASLERFKEAGSAQYSVAWLDGLCARPKRGRAVIMTGDHLGAGAVATHTNASFDIPRGLPGIFLNSVTGRTFNALFFELAARKRNVCEVHYNKYFYPLDKLPHWNRLYGKRGLVQYQFVLPTANSADGIREIFRQMTTLGLHPFLIVMKAFGSKNQNLMSFPIEGTSLAIDFKASPATLLALDQLDKIVLDFGGRLNLTKDSRVSAEVFKAMYPSWEEFARVRAKYYAQGKFESLQSVRLGIE